MRHALARLLSRLGEALYRLARRLDPDSPPWPRLPEISYSDPTSHGSIHQGHQLLSDAMIQGDHLCR